MKFCWIILLFIYQVLSRLSFISALGMMTRITSQVSSFQTTELLTFVAAGEVMAGEWRALADSPLFCALARQNRPLRRRQIVGFALFPFLIFSWSPTRSISPYVSLDDGTNSWASQRKVKLFCGVVFYDLTLWVITQLFRAIKVKSLFARIQEWYTVNSLKGTQINQEGYKVGFHSHQR